MYEPGNAMTADRLLLAPRARAAQLRSRIEARAAAVSLRLLLAVFLALATSLFAGGRAALAYTPDSPEVQQLIKNGLKYLDKQAHPDVGGKCLVALAYLKHGASQGHPRIQEALTACREGKVHVRTTKSYNYGKSLAIIFLCELDSKAHRSLIDEYVDMLRQHQKDHGGFGYLGAELGDTSQTQYAALAYWEMLNHGISPDAGSVQRCIKWVMRTRDPRGMWGYQAVDPGGMQLVKQESRPGHSMTAAGMSAAMILGNSIGLLEPPKAGKATDDLQLELPPALRRQQTEEVKRAPTLPAGDVNPTHLAETLKAGRAWFDKNFTLELHEYPSYYLYSVERYKSFEEFLSGEREEEPEWYTNGVKLLQETQQSDGSWSDEQGPPAATAFSILFLLRSTQKSIEARLGEGTLVGGRGLPRDLSKLKLRGGKLVVESAPTEVDRLLELLDEPGSAAFETLLDDPAALQVADVGPDEARRLQQIVKSGSAGARLMAVRALSQMRDLDYAPTLIFALTDPDKRVVREARDGLRSVSRNFEGFGPPDNFEDGQRAQAIERWKAWYKAARPDAPPLP